ncbi:hypothetical protein B0T24DRAFT_641566 [Lasiosphaeria ovina]|uniref:Uncharacterized protein n=1 Tax=Lasiosphaeria ovina TaxID=92902 RepID=A0AAE0JTY3_9PEZI|nr:hypothetical protein B0T24DRAFT_641566 [Lasiosphaeria ovina]
MDDSTSCNIEVNPDIIGIGVRVALYVQALAGPIASFAAPKGSRKLLALANKTMGFMGLALLITSFSFAGKHELDLFHALCLFHLIGLVGLSISGAGEEKHSSSVVEFGSRVLHYLGLLGFFIFQIYVFATAPTFGPQPECNDGVRYVLFGIDTPATSPAFRGLFIAMFAIMLFVSVLSLLRDESDESDENKGDYIMGKILETVLRLLCFGEGAIFLLLMAFFAKMKKSRQEDDGKEGYKLLGEVVGRSYVIVMLELIIHRNSDSSTANEWGFGQILSMVLLLGPLAELVSGYSESKGPSFTHNDRFRFFLQPLIRIVVSAVDLAICAAGGAAAAATGAHVNGDPVTSGIVRYGALGGVIGSGVLGVCVFVAKAASTVTSSTLVFAVSPLGAGFAIALAICNRVLGEAPNAILLGAILGGIPTIFGSSWNAAGGPNRSLLIMADAVRASSDAIGLSLFVVSILAALAGIGFDAIGGAVFAQVARTNGFPICTLGSAAAAGAVYSVIVYILHIPQSIGWISLSRGHHPSFSDSD